MEMDKDKNKEFTQEINGSWKYDKILSFTIVRIQIKAYTKINFHSQRFKLDKTL